MAALLLKKALTFQTAKGNVELTKTTHQDFTLLKGLGTWHHSIATKSADAQKFFDQGLTLLYGFNRYEALRSFKRAAELDPEAAMAYWGMAMVLGPYINMDMDQSLHMKDACDAVGKGLSLHGIRLGLQFRGGLARLSSGAARVAGGAASC